MSSPIHEDSAEANPHKELLAEAAEAVRADEQAREQRRPKNIGQGAVGLVGDSLGGVALGAAAVVRGPVEGYKQAGPKGIIGGLLGGLVVGVGSAAYGIGSGIAKFAQGTNRTVSSSRTLPDKYLVAENYPVGDYRAERTAVYGNLIAEFQSSNSSAAGTLQPPVENELYKVLDVAVDATPAQIRKAYYRMAQRYHPDKHPDDTEATAKFQKISEAYQVLSDPVKREDYHRLGASVANGESMMDPKALFALMFSDFDHLVGDLATSTLLATMAAGAEGNEESPEAVAARNEKRKEFQKAREALLIRLLNRRLDAWVRGDESSFIKHAKHEVAALRLEPFGRDLLKTVAYIYKKRASKALDNGKGPLSGMSSFFDDLGDKAHSIKSQARAIEGGMKVIAGSGAASENESIDEAARREAVNTVGAVWLASVVDIERTLKHVVDGVLRDGQEEGDEKLIAKAEGLLALAKIFQQA